ncbi:dihydroneopterin aldolase [Slackia heliotrinireducens]|jgi:dihydroneopterin aldolase|uniref:dihydroneopterin aldolase n=1 Tax=Slackia heliotrinireducens TaxID=84110 RepID=UPI003316112E
MDCVCINDLEVFAHHGVLPEEREQGQTFYVDVELHMDLSVPGRSDNLNDAVNYAEVCAYINDEMHAVTFDLIEAVAEHLAAGILERFDKVDSLRLTVKKPHAPIPLPFGCVSVTVERAR